MCDVKDTAELPASRFTSRRNETGASFAAQSCTPTRTPGGDRPVWSERNHYGETDHTSLDGLIDRHIQAYLKKLNALGVGNNRRATGQRIPGAYESLSSGITEEEEASRLAILRYRPRSDCEAKRKITYLAAHLIATRGSLSADEMVLVSEDDVDKPRTSIC